MTVVYETVHMLRTIAEKSKFIPLFHKKLLSLSKNAVLAFAKCCRACNACAVFEKSTASKLHGEGPTNRTDLPLASLLRPSAPAEEEVLRTLHARSVFKLQLCRKAGSYRTGQVCCWTPRTATAQQQRWQQSRKLAELTKSIRHYFVSYGV